jgi:arylsulfatase A-like enzyme
MIVVDALRPDHVGCYGYDRPTSPNIDRLAERGVVFEHAICHAPWTKSSFASMMTSLYPFQHGVLEWASVMADTFVTLPEILTLNGYDTFAVINQVTLSDRFKVIRGFDEVSEAKEFERDAVETTDDCIDLIKRARRPFFLLVHYFDVHSPYDPPPEYVRLIRREGDMDPLREETADQGAGSDRHAVRDQLLYDGCIRYTDESVGRLIDYLDSQGLRQNTLIILTADHGEAFWEHGTFSHGEQLYDEAIKVPLILDPPGEDHRPAPISPQVQHVDLLPTIVDVAGITDTEYREGMSLLSLIETGERDGAGRGFLPEDVALCEGPILRTPGLKALRRSDWKVIVEPVTSTIEVYNLIEDPGEQVNLWGKATGAADTLLAMLQRVPGTNLRGWRLAVTGMSRKTLFKADVRVVGEGRFSSIRQFSRGNVTIEPSDDSTSFHFETHAARLRMIVFDTEPPGSDIEVRIAAEGQKPPEIFYLGESGTIPLAETTVVRANSAIGVPESFQEDSDFFKIGIHLWWLPGESLTQPRQATKLTPEEVKRLRSLGYIQ